MAGLTSHVCAISRRLEQRIDARFAAADLKLEAVKQELLATFRGELAAIVTYQTRAMIFGMLGMALTVGGVVVGIARFS